MSASANPTHFLADTDALIQILLTRPGQMLQWFRQKCGIALSVVPEVETEVRFHQKFGDQFEPEFCRRVEAHQIDVLDSTELRRMLRARGVPAHADDSELNDLYRSCEDYNRHVDVGEAYTHAIAARLGLPVVSHDWKAVQVLQRNGKLVGTPTFRFFDLLVFSFRCGTLTESECQSVLRVLKREREYVPREFSSSGGFSELAASFNCRIVQPQEGGSAGNDPNDTMIIDPGNT